MRIAAPTSAAVYLIKETKKRPIFSQVLSHALPPHHMVMVWSKHHFTTWRLKHINWSASLKFWYRFFLKKEYHQYNGAHIWRNYQTVWIPHGKRWPSLVFSFPCRVPVLFWSLFWCLHLGPSDVFYVCTAVDEPLKKTFQVWL